MKQTIPAEAFLVPPSIPTGPKVYNVTYPFSYCNETHAIRYSFANVKDADGNFENLDMKCLSGGGQKALLGFAGAILQTHARRKEFESWLEEQIAKQEN